MLSTAKLVIAPDWQAAWPAPTVAAIFALEVGTVVKRGHTTEVRRVEIGARTVFIKKYWANSFAQCWSGALRGTLFGKSKVQREYENMHRLRAWGLDSPAPVAYGEERRAGWVVRSCLISEAIPVAVPLDKFITETTPPHLNPLPQTTGARKPDSPLPLAGEGQGEGLLFRLADYVRRLHEHKFIHHDLYWRNIILSGQSLAHFYLIDMHKSQPGSAIEQDLAALDAPAPFFFRRTERLRFFLRYRQHESLTAEDKQLIARTLALAEPMRARQLKRIREARR